MDQYYSEEMKTNSREKLSAVLLMVVGLILMIILSGFSHSFSMRQNSANNPYLKGPGDARSANEITDASTGNNASQTTSDDTLITGDENYFYGSDIQSDSLLYQKIRKSIDEIDWNEIEKELGDIKIEFNMDSFHYELKKALMEIENIDWKKIQNDFEVAISKFDEVDFEEIIENARKEASEIDFEKIMEDTRKALEDIDMEKIMNDARQAMNDMDKEIDFEELKAEFQKSIKEIDFEEIKKEIEHEKECLRKEMDAQNPCKHKEN